MKVKLMSCLLSQRHCSPLCASWSMCFLCRVCANTTSETFVLKCQVCHLPQWAFSSFAPRQSPMFRGRQRISTASGSRQAGQVRPSSRHTRVSSTLIRPQVPVTSQPYGETNGAMLWRQLAGEDYVALRGHREETRLRIFSGTANPQLSQVLSLLCCLFGRGLFCSYGKLPLRRLIRDPASNIGRNCRHPAATGALAWLIIFPRTANLLLS